MWVVKERKESRMIPKCLPQMVGEPLRERGKGGRKELAFVGHVKRTLNSLVLSIWQGGGCGQLGEQRWGQLEWTPGEELSLHMWFWSDD